MASGARFDVQRATRADCIGRNQELAVVVDQWNAARQGRCRVVSLIGEAGIGKSRLLRTADERITTGAGSSVLMQCSPSRASVPLHPVIDWLRREIGVPQADPDRNRRLLGDWLGSGAGALDLALMAEFLSVPLDGDAAPPPLPPDRKRALTHDIVMRRLERHCNEAPLLLMVEDAHWMDGATDNFLHALFHRMRDRPLLAIITSRPGQVGRWGDPTTVAELTLNPLASVDAQQLIQASCQGRSLPASVVEQILARTDGVPLFIEELTANILESGLLREQGDAWVLEAPLPELDIPSTLRDSLMARLDRLSDIKEVARLGSAIGREFSFRLLQQVSGRPTDQLVAALNRLVDANLLFQRGSGAEAEYLFKHSLVQQAAYDSMLRADRRALHARIVRAIEAHQPEIAGREPGLMAHHCQLGGLADQEVDYLYKAGIASTRIVAIAEALSYFARADVAVSQLPTDARNARRAIDIILGMMEVGRFAILPSRLIALSEKARSLASSAGVTCDAATLAAILFQDGRAKLYSSNYADARTIFQEIRQLGLEQESRQIERKPASAFAMDLCCQGLFNEMLDFVDESGIDYYRESGSFIDYISGLGWIAYARCQIGPGDAGVHFGDLSVTEAGRVESQIYLAGAHIWRSHALMAVRRFDEAVSDAMQCVNLAEAHAVPYLGWHGLVFLALCQCRQGDLDAAEASLVRARALLSLVEDGRWSLLDYLPAIEAEIACQRGEHARSIELADAAIRIATPIGGHFAEAIAWRAKAVSALHSGADLQAAQALFERAMRLHRLGAAHAEAAFSALAWGWTLQACGHGRAAAHWIGQARELAQAHGFVLGRCELGGARALEIGSDLAAACVTDLR